jgi:RNA polymerase sigma factor (TIGR02999 family)
VALADRDQQPTSGHVALSSNDVGRMRDDLITRFYPELVQIAAARLRRETNCSLSTNDLINEVVLRLIRNKQIDVADKTHFIALSSRLMRNILIDHVRSKNAAKRNHVKIDLADNIEQNDGIDFVQLNDALIRLGAVDTQYVELVEMRYFGGMSIADIATVTGTSEATVYRRWQVARAWLLNALSSQTHDK